MDKLSYKCRDKRRPVIDVILTSLAIVGATAFTAGYIYWAIEGTHTYEKSVKSVKHMSQMERSVEIHNFGYEELSDKL